MLDLSWTTRQFAALPTAQRVLIVVDQASAHPRLLRKLVSAPNQMPTTVVWLWVVTPGAVVSWGALLAESGDRTRILLAALNQRIEEARRYVTPLQHACNLAEVPCQTHILHGAVTESVVRLAQAEQVEQVLLASTDGLLYGQSAQELANTLTRRLSSPLGILA